MGMANEESFQCGSVANVGHPGQGRQIEFLIEVSVDVFEQRGASAPNIQPSWLSWPIRLTPKIRGAPVLEIEYRMLTPTV